LAELSEFFFNIGVGGVERVFSFTSELTELAELNEFFLSHRSWRS
jgi:hypothetical protein